MKGKIRHSLRIIPCLLFAVLILATSCGGTGTTSGETIELKFATYNPPMGTVYEQMFTPWAQEIEERTDGRVKITFYPGESLAKAPDLYDAVLTGAADIVWTDPSFTPGVFPRSEITVQPMLYPSAEVAGDVMWRLIEKYMLDTEYQNVKVLWVTPLASMQVWTSNKQVTTLEDMEGMKFAAQTPVVASILEALGAVPTVMAEPEIYGALERGLVEGRIAEPELAWVFSSYDVTKYRTFGLDLGFNVGITLMNQDTWNSLPKDIQDIFTETTGRDFSIQCGKLMDDAAKIFEGLIKEADAAAGNPDFYIVSAAEKARWEASLEPVVVNWAAQKEADGIPAEDMLADAYAWIE